MTADQIRALDCMDPKQLPTGEWAALARFLFTVGLLVGIDEIGYRVRYCYPSYADAWAALAAWDGVGDPPGPWIKAKGEGGDRENPATFRGIAVIAAGLEAKP